MAGNVLNPRVWTGASVLNGPLGTAAPTNIATALNVAFVDVGFLDEDNGIEEAMSKSTSEHYAYGGYLLRTTSKQEKHTVKFWALERTVGVEGLINPSGAATTTTGVATITKKLWKPNPQAFVIVRTDGTTVTSRLYIPRGDVVEAVDTIKSDDAAMIMYGITITCYPDSTGLWATEFSNDPAIAV